MREARGRLLWNLGWFPRASSLAAARWLALMLAHLVHDSSRKPPRLTVASPVPPSRKRAWRPEKDRRSRPPEHLQRRPARRTGQLPFLRASALARQLALARMPTLSGRSPRCRRYTRRRPLPAGGALASGCLLCAVASNRLQLTFASPLPRLTSDASAVDRDENTPPHDDGALAIARQLGRTAAQLLRTPTSGWPRSGHTPRFRRSLLLVRCVRTTHLVAALKPHPRVHPP